MTIAEQYEWHQAYLRRHRVSRRNFLRGSAAAAAVAALGVSPFGRRAYAEDAPLAVANRRVGYGADASSQLRFAAQLSRNPGRTKVFLDHGPTFALGASAEAEVRNLVTQIPASSGGVLAAEQFYVHVPVDDLPARMPHFYRWRTDDGFTGDILPATTAMANARNALSPFRFTMMGDQGTDDTPVLPPGVAPGIYDDRYYKADNDPAAAHTANVLNQIIASRPDFHVLAGDIAYADPSGLGKPATFMASAADPPSGFDKFNPFVWDVYLGSIEASASTTPWMFATGNHDMEAAYPTHGYGGHLARLDFPRNGPTACPSVYSFVYGNVAVLSLDANDVSYEIKTNTGYSGGAQNTWVARTLAAHRANPDIDFIVCFFHHCAYSTTAAHASDGGVRAAWCDLFDRHQVDLVLQGPQPCVRTHRPHPGQQTDHGRRRQRGRLPRDRRHRVLHRGLRRTAALRLPARRGRKLPRQRTRRYLRAQQLRLDRARRQARGGGRLVAGAVRQLRLHSCRCAARAP